MITKVVFDVDFNILEFRAGFLDYQCFRDHFCVVSTERYVLRI
jgi:hypothetical protein